MCFRDTACVVALLSLQQSAGLDSGIIWVTMASTATSFTASFFLVVYNCLTLVFNKVRNSSLQCMCHIVVHASGWDADGFCKNAWTTRLVGVRLFFKIFYAMASCQCKAWSFVENSPDRHILKNRTVPFGTLEGQRAGIITDWRRCWLDHFKGCHKGLVAKYLWSVVNFLSTLLDVWMWHFPCNNNAMNTWPKWHLSADCMRFGHFL